jgi:hypothetical protein
MLCCKSANLSKQIGKLTSLVLTCGQQKLFSCEAVASYKAYQVSVLLAAACCNDCHPPQKVMTAARNLPVRCMCTGSHLTQNYSPLLKWSCNWDQYRLSTSCPWTKLHKNHTSILLQQVTPAL